MIVTRIIGGLGNQMFQYAAASALCNRAKHELRLDVSAFQTYKLHGYGLGNFKISEKIIDKSEFAVGPSTSIIDSISRTYHRKKSLNLYKERSLTFEPEFLTLNCNTYLDGYWQSEKYFKDFEENIRKDFRFRHSPSAENQKMLNYINSVNAVSIHVRRGDYVSNPLVSSVHGTCDIDYYRRAIYHLSAQNNHSENMKFFIFSDDVNWVKQNMDLSADTVYVNHNDATSNFEDMRLMSACKHHIIANSSFSWWGAWLNPSKIKRVIAPKKWFATKDLHSVDLIPSNWIQV